MEDLNETMQYNPRCMYPLNDWLSFTALQEDIAEFEMLRARASSTSSPGANRPAASGDNNSHATPAPQGAPATRRAEAAARDRRVRGGGGN
jgi:hypothetical protein